MGIGGVDGQGAFLGRRYGHANASARSDGGETSCRHEQAPSQLSPQSGSQQHDPAELGMQDRPLRNEGSAFACARACVHVCMHDAG